MADNTPIEWTDATWNPITGCSVVSPGCTNCYAMRLAGTRLRHHPSRVGLTKASKAGPVWNGTVLFNEPALNMPLRWTRPRRIFVCAHGDLFAENVPDEWIDRVFHIMALSPRHTFQVLTKRPGRMRDYLTNPATQKLYPGLPLPNVWLGVSVEDQRRADQRVPILLDTPAAIRFVSAEPLLGPVSIGYLRWQTENCYPRIDWVIVGGESGPGARPMQAEWARALRDQCATARVPFFFKQWGNHRSCSVANGPYLLPCCKKEAGRLLDGVEHSAMPEVRP